MILWVFTRDDETGLLDDEFKDGDVLQTKPDSFESSIGGQEKKSFLIVKIPDPPNPTKVEPELVASEYNAGATPQDDHVIRRKRKYRLDWRTKFTATEIGVVEDATQTLPDGVTAQGGTVTSGVVDGLFEITDLRRK